MPEKLLFRISPLFNCSRVLFLLIPTESKFNSAPSKNVGVPAILFPSFFFPPFLLPSFLDFSHLSLAKYWRFRASYLCLICLNCVLRAVNWAVLKSSSCDFLLFSSSGIWGFASGSNVFEAKMIELFWIKKCSLNVWLILS